MPHHLGLPWQLREMSKIRLLYTHTEKGLLDMQWFWSVIRQSSQQFVCINLQLLLNLYFGRNWCSRAISKTWLLAPDRRPLTKFAPISGSLLALFPLLFMSSSYFRPLLKRHLLRLHWRAPLLFSLSLLCLICGFYRCAFPEIVLIFFSDM